MNSKIECEMLSGDHENFVRGLSLRARGYRDNVLPLLAEALRNG